MDRQRLFACLFEPRQPDMRRCRCCIVRKDGTCLPALKNASVLRGDPGNVRELKNTPEYVFVIAGSGQIAVEHLPPALSSDSTGSTVSRNTAADGTQGRRTLVEALRRTGGNQTQAAKLLGINRVTVWNRMRKYGIDLNNVLEAGGASQTPAV